MPYRYLFCLFFSPKYLKVYLFPAHVPGQQPLLSVPLPLEATLLLYLSHKGQKYWPGIQLIMVS
jgi:hypothetical protein|tara:strand:+ start:304 stop:495 length:192 start_codon:yes stop_codon:yes gene_type:complete